MTHRGPSVRRERAVESSLKNIFNALQKKKKKQVLIHVMESFARSLPISPEQPCTSKGAFDLHDMSRS